MHGPPEFHRLLKVEYLRDQPWLALQRLDYYSTRSRIPHRSLAVWDWLPAPSACGALRPLTEPPGVFQR